MVHKNKKNSHWGKMFASILLIFISIVVAIITIITSAKRDLTQLENSLLWIFGLAAALVGSYMFAKQSFPKAAFDIIKPHARPAFRRLLWLYKSLSRLAYVISEAQETKQCENIYILSKLKAMVIEQIATAGDAVEDWRDIIPEDVEEIMERIEEKEEN